MILVLSEKYNKSIARFFLSVFYVSSALTSYAANNVDDAIRLRHTGIQQHQLTKTVASNVSMPVNKTNFQGNKKPALSNVLSSPELEDIGGPSQPEMSSFKSVGTDNMVNLFTGDFSYNIPLLDVGGYPINIYYNGGITMEQEASWVGLGWNINPGNINRNMRGVPDDFNGDEMVQIQNTKPNKTWGANVKGDLEIIGIKSKFLNSLSRIGMSFNNYLGPSLELSKSLSFDIFKTTLSEKVTDTSGAFLSANAGLNLSLNSRYGMTISPSVSLSATMFKQSQTVKTGFGLSTSYNSRNGIKDLQLNWQSSFSKIQKFNVEKDGLTITKERKTSLTSNIYSTTISFLKPSYSPSIRIPTTNTAYSGRFQFSPASVNGVHKSIEADVYVQKSEISPDDQVQIKPMVGYLYSEYAVNDNKVVMDFSRINDNEVTPNTPVISAPQYTYDVFSIQGEGTGGTIRAYRNDIGYMKDNLVESKDKSLTLGADVGVPGHYGGSYSNFKTKSSIQEWNDGNLLKDKVGFTGGQSVWENVYFRNPGETSVVDLNDFDAIGGTDLVRFQLGGSNYSPTVEPMLNRYSLENSLKGQATIANPLQSGQKRQKRTQVINFFTAKDASQVGLEKTIRSYSYTIPFTLQNNLSYSEAGRVSAIRKSHHISQINVTEPNGSRYIYGLPVYNILQRDYTFSVSNTDNAETGIVSFNPNEASQTSPLVASNSDRDGYVQITETPAYAHSFLLTGLLSPDYVDITGNGITEDDLGDAVKFNYNQLTDETGVPVVHKWRTPHTSAANTANFNRGKNTTIKDDKGIISYGERESWYLHSIESKTMIALFTVEDRDDDKGPIDAFGGVNVNDKSSKRLRQIDLYSKADLKKNGKNGARPIKTVHFEYTYTLCTNTPDNKNQQGKLTLEKIYFTYNGQSRGNKNQYVFSYGNNTSVVDNPQYEFNASDRWGNYKPNSINPGNLKNSQFPYCLQDKNKKTDIDNYAAAWSLKKILLPSGGQIEVDYESDDYAYVQDRHATSMLQILGFGSNSSEITDKLYKVGGIPVFSGITTITENNYVFINIPESCATKEEVYQRYLKGLEQLCFSVAVYMPNGLERIKAYAFLDDYGIYGSNSIWIKFKSVDGISPVSLTAVEFLREQLPGQAYPAYDISGDPPLKQAGDMLLGMLDGIRSMFSNPLEHLRMQGKARKVELSQSFVRLNDADGIKYGGGIRVKQVRLKDNWQPMTQQYTSVYGQQYEYTTNENFMGTTRKISSGVASYEPSIGGEENPFQNIIQFANKLPMGPTSYGSLENPILDAFFPYPLVGYSKVTVRSLKQTNDTTKRSRSGIGRQVTEFYTAKDYPLKWAYTNRTSESDRINHKGASWFFYSYNYDNRAISQGFFVETNDMHGKLKSQTSYAENDESLVVNYTENFYRNTGSTNNDKFKFVYAKQGGIIKDGNMGIDIELMTDTREFVSKGKNFELQAQTDMFIPFIPIWLPFPWPTFGNNESVYKAVTTTKLVNYHAILDSVVVIDKGSAVSTKNLIYDAETGGVIVKRTNNEFEKPVYSTSYPAYWAYSGMGLAYENIDVVYGNIDFSDGKITTPGFDMSIFESGDELYIFNKGFEPDSYCDRKMQSLSDTIIWAYDTTKDASSINSNPYFLFMNAKGKLFTKKGVGVRIIRSGKRNLLAANLQDVVSMSTPIVSSNGNQKLLFTADSKVINASAAEFSEKWQVDDGVLERIKFDTVWNGCSYTPRETVVTCGNLSPNVNPYRKGLLGNFRPFRGYTFYGNRTENDPNVSTNIIQNGFLSDFSLFWDYNNNNKLIQQNTLGKWVWNSKLTKVNAKGQELETKNALNIYTAAQYGYQKSTVIAVANNARYDEMGFDGFEDYEYSESTNGSTLSECNPHFKFLSPLFSEQLAGRPGPGLPSSTAPVRLVNTDTTAFDAHTGKYVFAIDSGVAGITAFLSKNFTVDTFNMPLLPGSKNYAPLIGGATGVKYYLYCGGQLKDSMAGGSLTGVNWDNPYSQAQGNPCTYYGYVGAAEIVTKFFFKPEDTELNIKVSYYRKGGQYNIYIIKDSSYYNPGILPQSSTDKIYVGSKNIQNNDNSTFLSCQNLGSIHQETDAHQYSFCPNKWYQIILKYVPRSDIYDNLTCTGNGIDGPYSNEAIVSYGCVVGPSTFASGVSNVYHSLTQVDSTCYFTKPIKGVDSMLNPFFTVPQEKKMVFSAWVRESCGNTATGVPCLNETYQLNTIRVSYNTAQSTTQFLYFKPSGPIIDGWQRYDTTFTVPLGTQSVVFELINNGSKTIYFDDVRIHPFNSNMKSFVYDPINLRLVADLDENNYASFYEYDEEGTLIRTKAETREGIKMISETRSAKQKNINTVQP